MRTRLPLFALVFLASAVGLIAGTAYYVDATSGSDANDGRSVQKPWKTIAKVNKASFAPGDSVLFKRGETWRETLVPPSNGISGNPITFGAYGTGPLPTIDATGKAYGLTSGKEHITVADLHFKSASSWAINHSHWDSQGHILPMPGWLVKNCEFTRCGVFLFGPGTVVQDCLFTGPAVRTADQAAIAFSGPVSANCSALRNNISNFTSRGIWFNGVSGAATANGNVIRDIAYTVGTTFEGYGINFDGFASPIGGAVTAHGNTVYNCARNGIKTENCSEGISFSGNLIHDCSDSGILCMNYRARAAAPPYPAYIDQRGRAVKGILAYNVIYRCQIAIMLKDVSDVDVWNNTLADGTGPYPCGLKIDDGGTYFVKDVDVRNNVFYGAMTRAVSTEKTWDKHVSVFDHNAVLNPVIEVRSTSTRLTLAQLQSAGAAVNSFTTSPGFVDPSARDFHLLSSSPCINAGAIVGLTRDHDGKNINGLPDIGAYESGPPTSTTPPLVTTTVPSAIKTTSATAGGIVTSDGGGTVMERGLCWGTEVNPSLSGSHTHDGTGTGVYVSSMTGLNPNTPYHIRAYATNSSGTGYGADILFTTVQALTLASVSTATAGSISSSSAMTGGTVASDGGSSVTERGVCWGTAANPTVSGPHTHDGFGTGAFTSSLSGLSPNTTYHIRAFATNSQGTAYGGDMSFTTLQGISLASVTTSAASSISSTGALTGGVVVSDGGASVTERGVCWGTAANPTISSARSHDGSGTGTFTCSLSGLIPNTTYHVRAYATNSAGTGYGNDVTFTTQPVLALASVSTTAASSMTSTGALTGGTVTSDGGSFVTERGVCWSTAANPTVSGSHSHDGSGTGTFTCSLSGLIPNTTYHVRAYATNSQGTAYGSDSSFTTTQGVSMALVTTAAASSITSTGALAGGIVASDGGASVTERGVCWSTAANPTVSGLHTHDGAGTGAFTSNLSGLSPNTAYFVRAYATNASGTAYGADLSFSTTATDVRTVPLAESFAGNVLPSGWVTQNEGAGIVDKWEVSETSLAGGNPNEVSCTWQDVNPGKSRLVSPPIDTTGYSTLYLNFRQVLTTIESGGVTIKVQTSPDGTTWTDEEWSAIITDSDRGPEVVTAMLTQNMNRAMTFVGFQISGNLHYFDKWYIDDIRITSTSPLSLKAPSPSSPRDKSTNQPTIINLKWRDTNTRNQESGYRVRFRPEEGEYRYYEVGQDVKSIEVPGLATNARYYWNVMAMGDGLLRDDSAWANSGKDRLFTTGSISTLFSPVPLAIKAMSLDQPTSVVLEWQDTNSVPQEAKFEIRIKPDSGKYVRYSASADTISLVVPDLKRNTKYQWNIRAKGDRKKTKNSKWGNAGVDIGFQTPQ